MSKHKTSLKDKSDSLTYSILSKYINGDYRDTIKTAKKLENIEISGMTSLFNFAKTGQVSDRESISALAKRTDNLRQLSRLAEELSLLHLGGHELDKDKADNTHSGDRSALEETITSVLEFTSFDNVLRPAERGLYNFLLRDALSISLKHKFYAHAEVFGQELVKGLGHDYNSALLTCAIVTHELGDREAALDYLGHICVKPELYERVWTSVTNKIPITPEVISTIQKELEDSNKKRVETTKIALDHIYNNKNFGTSFPEGFSVQKLEEVLLDCQKFLAPLFGFKPAFTFELSDTVEDCARVLYDCEDTVREECLFESRKPNVGISTYYGTKCDESKRIDIGSWLYAKPTTNSEIAWFVSHIMIDNLPTRPNASIVYILASLGKIAYKDYKGTEQNDIVDGNIYSPRIREEKQDELQDLGEMITQEHNQIDVDVIEPLYKSIGKEAISSLTKGNATELIKQRTGIDINCQENIIDEIDAEIRKQYKKPSRD